MIEFSDEAIILSSRKFGESSAIASFLTRNHGLYSGVIRGGNSRRMRGVLEPGNRVQLTWKARLAEHMGSAGCELLEPVAAYLLDSRFKLSALQAAAVMVENCLTEREPHPNLYADLQGLLLAMKHDHAEWLMFYVLLELDLLALAGFGLDLSACAASGTSDSLVYVSPRSGRAVSREAGAAYHDKLLPLPQFLLAQRGEDKIADIQQIIDGLRLTGYFLDTRLFAAHNRIMPQARERFVKLVEGDGSAFNPLPKGEGGERKGVVFGI